MCYGKSKLTASAAESERLYLSPTTEQDDVEDKDRAWTGSKRELTNTQNTHSFKIKMSERLINNDVGINTDFLMMEKHKHDV